MRQTPSSIRIIASSLPSLLEPYQTEWSYLWENNAIPPFSVIQHNVITIEAGYRMRLKGVMCSASIGGTIPSDALHRIWIVITTPGFLGDRFFRRTDALTFDPSQEIKGGHSLILYFYNASSEEVRVTTNILGVKEKT